MKTKKTILMGPAGSGKTTYLLQDFENRHKESSDILENDFFFIVPSMEHTERIMSLLLQKPMKGFFHQRVTTLSQSIRDLFLLGDERVATNITRFLIVRGILEKNQWEVFKDVYQTKGFLNLILSFLAEVKESRITLEIFRERMQKLVQIETDHASKYQALVAIYELYEEELENQGLIDKADQLQLYQERKRAGNLQKKRFKKIWLDGFFDFSAIQMAYLDELCELTDEIVVTLTLDPQENRANLFEIVEKTRKELVAKGFECQNFNRRPNQNTPKVLQHLEKHIFSESMTEQIKIEPSQEITIFKSIGIEGEIEMIARTIQFMQKRGDYRFSDFCILLRQIGEYEQVIRSVFKKYQIPLEIHERERLQFSPQIKAITSLLRIFRDEWAVASVIDFLKSSYVRKMASEEKEQLWVAELDHQAIQAGFFKGRAAWFERWESHSEEECHEKKVKLLAPLRDLEDSLRNAKNFKELKDKLCNAVEKTFEIFTQYDSTEEYIRRDAASQKRFYALLDEIERSLLKKKKSEGVDFDAFIDRFFKLVELDLYSLRHRNQNKVQVYNVSLARQKEYQIVFVAGLLEKKFPVQIKEDALLSDWERKLFNGTHTESILKEKLPSQMMERYLFYLATTRAQKRLFLSFPKFDLEGKESLPSFYIQEVYSLFKSKLQDRHQHLSRPYPALHEVINSRELEMSVLGEVWQQETASDRKNELFLLTRYLMQHPKARKHILKSLYVIHDELTDEKFKDMDLFKTALTSPTALEEYAKCPFKYYAHRVLKLEDPYEDTNITARGIILHEVFELFFKDWANDVKLQKNRQACLDRALSYLEKAIEAHRLIYEKKYQYNLEIRDLYEMSERFIAQELTRLETALLKPAFFEYEFGSFEEEKPGLEIKSGDKTTQIRGKIDRIDLDESGKNGLVLDYKRTASFKRMDMEFGISLQLVIYVKVLQEILKLKGIGAELYSVKKCEKNGFYLEDFLGAFPGVTRKRMVLSENEFQKLIARGTAFMEKFISDMHALRMKAEPRFCDPYCLYDSICRIEKWKLPLITEKIKAEDLEDPTLQGLVHGN
jgi:ATP-dependent helicase/nuclease subunit B